MVLECVNTQTLNKSKIVMEGRKLHLLTESTPADSKVLHNSQINVTERKETMSLWIGVRMRFSGHIGVGATNICKPEVRREGL